MAFDGITVHALVKEFQELLTNGRLSKIAQPEADELLLTIKAPNGNYRLLLSANAGLPLLHLTDNNKTSPLTAPNFCMLLRKHIANGRIVSVTQPGLERVVDFAIEHLDEMGDLKHKHLLIELMGKYSNIIFTDDDNRIIDAIKRVPPSLSSVREVLPGAQYFIPNTTDKIDPLNLSADEIGAHLFAGNKSIRQAIYQSFTGISPQIADYLCTVADIEARKPVGECTDSEKLHLSHLMADLMEDVREGRFAPTIFCECDIPIEYSALCELQCIYPEGTVSLSLSSPSAMIERYYARRAGINRMRSRSADLRQVIHLLLERNRKKFELQEQQLADTEAREQCRIFGELLSAYSYQIVSGASEARVMNYYTNEEVTIPLDSDLSIQDNAQKYFARYNKYKRTYEALTEWIAETQKAIEHLESIDNALDLAEEDSDLSEIREEMIAYGFLKSKGNRKGRSVKAKPLHYRSSDGFDLYVGKNNLQNEEVTFNLAVGDDWWFHSKKFPGSHVIVKANHRELPDRTFEEAAALAAYYSKGRDQEKVEIDYVQRKHLRKVSGAAPGFVIYHTNYSLAIAPNIDHLTEIS